MHALHAGRPAGPLDLLQREPPLTPDERAVRDSVGAFCDRRAEPHIASCFEHGAIEDIRGLTRALGEFGVLGMHPEGRSRRGIHPWGQWSPLALTAALELNDRRARRAVATICAGAGQGTAVCSKPPDHDWRLA